MAEIGLDFSDVAPPKRKTGGGRVTPKGTRPGGHLTKSTHVDELSRSQKSADRMTEAPDYVKPAPWAPYVGLGLIGAGIVLIISRNLWFSSNNWVLFGALVAMMAGMWALTKWR